jgi:hypothetical protein
MKVRIAIVLFVLSLFAFFASDSQAFMHRVWVNAFTQVDAGQLDNKLLITVEVNDDDYAHPPDFVKEIRITAPKPDPLTPGQVFYVDLSKEWYPWDKIFVKTLFPGDFEGKAILGGTYAVRVTPDTGTAITETDVVAATFLPVPEVSYPTAGLLGVPEIPIFTWSAVKGATYYRIKLLNTDWREPVYWTTFRTKHTDFNYYQIPPGDLKPNTNYSLQIEARAGSQDLDTRSRSAWINFRTGAW